MHGFPIHCRGIW